ncbi:MAG: cardiolipin synthase [Thermoanaerobaculia bacterium]
MSWIEYRRQTHTVRIPFVLFGGLIFVVAAMTIMLWSIWRNRSLVMQVKDTGDLQALLPSIVGITQGSLEKGNQVQLLENGDGFFPLLLRDIAAARESVHVESYIWETGEICDRVARGLADKAKQGVEVRLLVDASGGHKMDDKLEKMMTAAGVHVAHFHPVRFSNIGRLNNRDHRKMMIIDGRIGFIGGYGISESWTGHAQDKKHFRDTGLRMEGPIVNKMQGAFCENWIEETGEIPAGERYFPHLTTEGTISAHLAYTSPTGSISSVQVLHYLAIKAAHKEIIIQNPYLLPDDNAIDALAEAVKRGVNVMVMVPAASSTDSPIVQHASHHNFGTLLKRGIHVFEYKRTLLHQKILVIDGRWASIGSTNFDDRSFQLNDEVTVGVVDSNIAAQLKAAFENDLKDAEERHMDEWQNRSLWHKLEDGLAYLARQQL